MANHNRIRQQSRTKTKIYRCEWIEIDGSECGELFQGRQKYDYHMSAHKKMAPKTAEIPAPRPRKVYHVPSGDVPRLIEGESE